MLIRTAPADGSVVARAPHEVLVEFDDSVRVGSDNAAVANVSRRSVIGAPPRAAGRVLTCRSRATCRAVRTRSAGASSPRTATPSRACSRSPSARPDRGRSRCSVRRRRPGSATSPSALSTCSGRSSPPARWSSPCSSRPAAERACAGRSPSCSSPACFAAFLGASGLEHAAASGTRFALLTRVAAVLAVVGAGSAALALAALTLLLAAGALAVALLTLPAFAGHALDTTQPRLLAVGVDLVHPWRGRRLAGRPRRAGLRAPACDSGRPRHRCRASTVLDDCARRGRAARRERVGRALTELGAVSQLWSTSYGRALHRQDRALRGSARSRLGGQPDSLTVEPHADARTVVEIGGP